MPATRLHRRHDHSPPIPQAHRVVIVGGGAGGLELATALGDKYGRGGRAVGHAGRQDAHARLEAEAARDRRRQHGHRASHEVDFLAQSHWHHFRYRIGEMTGLDRERREVQVAAFVDDGGEQVTPRRTFGYDTLVICVGSQSNDFGTPGVRRARDEARIDGRCAALSTAAWSTPSSARMRRPSRCAPHQLQVAIIGAGATGVELAAELHRTTREVVAYGLDRVDPDKDMRLT